MQGQLFLELIVILLRLFLLILNYFILMIWI